MQSGGVEGENNLEISKKKAEERKMLQLSPYFDNRRGSSTEPNCCRVVVPSSGNRFLMGNCIPNSAQGRAQCGMLYHVIHLSLSSCSFPDCEGLPRGMAAWNVGRPARPHDTDGHDLCQACPRERTGRQSRTLDWYFFFFFKLNHNADNRLLKAI